MCIVSNKVNFIYRLNSFRLFPSPSLLDVIYIRYLYTHQDVSSWCVYLSPIISPKTEIGTKIGIQFTSNLLQVRV